MWYAPYNCCRALPPWAKAPAVSMFAEATSIRTSFCWMRLRYIIHRTCSVSSLFFSFPFFSSLSISARFLEFFIPNDVLIFFQFPFKIHFLEFFVFFPFKIHTFWIFSFKLHTFSYLFNSFLFFFLFFIFFFFIFISFFLFSSFFFLFLFFLLFF